MWEGREQSAGEPSRYGSQPERTAPARIPDPGRRPYLALPRGSVLRAAPRPPPSLAPGGAAPSRSKPAPRLCCRSERPRREQGSETEGRGKEAPPAEERRLARERRAQPLRPSPASPRPRGSRAAGRIQMRGRSRAGPQRGRVHTRAGQPGYCEGLAEGPKHKWPARHLRRHT